MDATFWVSLPAVIAAGTAAVATLRGNKKTQEISANVAPNGHGKTLVQLVEGISDKLDGHIKDHLRWDGTSPVPQRRASDPKIPGGIVGSSGSIDIPPGPRDTLGP